MSNLKNSEILSLKVVDEFLSQRVNQRICVILGSACKSNSSTVISAYSLWVRAAADSLPLSGTPPFNGWKRWIDHLTSIPFRDVVAACKCTAHELVITSAVHYEDFKHLLRQQYPFIGDLISPMKEIIDRWLSMSDTNALSTCYSWFLFLSRVHLTDDPENEKKAMDSYLFAEERTLPEFTSEESQLISKWFPRTPIDQYYDRLEYECQHGPGATADAGRNLYSKYLSLATDARINYMTDHRGELYPREPVHGFDRTSKTIFVPKDADSYRVISMEPATLMWYQKGIRKIMLRYMLHHPLAKRVSLDHQEYNRDLAWLGSIDGSFSTIDLTSASDYVAWDLVKKWFHKTWLYKGLLCTRSVRTQLPSGDVVALKKYAPMGSDLAFPIECVVFSAVVECAIRESGAHPAQSLYRVYGDDIIVESEYYQQVVNRLQRNGFLVNTRKSFSGQQPRGFFRESCGGYYYNGHDISPVRLSRRFKGMRSYSEMTPENITALIELANDCHSRYPSVRRCLVQYLIEMPRHRRPIFTCDGDRGLYSVQPTNFHLKERYNCDLQRHEHQHGEHVLRFRDNCEEWEDIRLYETLRQTTMRAQLTWPDDRVSVMSAPGLPRSIWATRWSGDY